MRCHYLLGQWRWKDRRKTAWHPGRINHDRKIRSRKQKTYIGKYSFVNRSIQLWNQLPADALGTLPCKPSNFRKRVRKVINKAKWMCGRNHPKMQWSEVKRSELWWGFEGYVSVVKWNEGKVMVKCECISSWHYVSHYCHCLLYTYFFVSLIYITVVGIVFALYSICVVCPLLFV
jgi:hypothetical protein